MVQDSELVTLLFTAAVAIALPAAARGLRFPGLGPALAGFFFIATGSLATVLEGFCWYDGFNVIEHLCHAAAGVAFCVGLIRANRRPRAQGAR